MYMRCSWIASLAVMLVPTWSGNVSAADLPDAPPISAPAPVVAPAQSWTGIYLGVAGGAALGRSQDINADPNVPIGIGVPISNPFSIGGWLAGGTIGYNFQLANWVFGAEGDFSWVDQKGSANDIPPFNPTVIDTTDTQWLATVRMRVGAVLADQWLVYATGGFAMARVEASVATIAHGTFSQTQNELGWTVGGGAEYAFNRNWSAKLEYLYVGLEASTYFSPGITFPGVIGPGRLDTRTVSLNENIVRVGINYILH